jgi:cellobiose phosphorylase
MYRVGLEAILGFVKRGDALFIEPCVPAAWPGFSIEYRYGGSRYTITVQRSNEASGAGKVTLDGVVLQGRGIPLVDDGATHAVVVTLNAVKGT